MRILIVNDDSVHASQLMPLIRWCQKLGQVTAVVPSVEQSGKSHGIEIHQPFGARQLDSEADYTLWTVDSTPADCVRFAVLGMGMQFDLVISGINKGLNIGRDILYSGTASAAAEAVALGIPAIAVSTTPKAYDRATEQLDTILAFFLEHKLMEIHNFYNVNIPGQVHGIRITHQGGPYYSDDFVPIGNDLYRPTGKAVYQENNDYCVDTDAALHGYISIMPMTINRTQMAVFDTLKHLNP